MKTALFSMVAGLTLQVAAARLGAQAADRFIPGARVRVGFAYDTTRRETGVYVGARPDTLVLLLEGTSHPRAIARADIRSIETSAGAEENGVRGLLIGGATGAGLGVLLAYFLHAGGGMTCQASSQSHETTCSAQEATSWHDDGISNAKVGVVMGAIIGGLIGHNTLSEEWEQVSEPNVSAIIGCHGAGLAFYF